MSKEKPKEKQNSESRIISFYIIYDHHQIWYVYCDYWKPQTAHSEALLHLGLDICGVHHHIYDIICSLLIMSDMIWGYIGYPHIGVKRRPYMHQCVFLHIIIIVSDMTPKISHAKAFGLWWPKDQRKENCMGTWWEGILLIRKNQFLRWVGCTLWLQPVFLLLWAGFLEYASDTCCLAIVIGS